MFKGETLDVEALDRELRALLARQGRATLLLNDPCHNPTGYSMSDEDWRAVGQVIEACVSLGPISVVLDSAYAAFSEGSLERPVQALAGLSSRVLLAFCWSASKTFLLYGQRVGALVVVPPTTDDMAEIEGALLYACRGTWSNGNHAGMLASTRLLADPVLRPEVDAQRARVRGLLDERVSRWNAVARPLGLAYPRYDGGFFVTVTSSDPARHAAALREQDCFVVPVAGALRVALCSVATRDVERLARTMATVLAT
jgi:aromatic-amino-acid transaminase